MSSEQPRFPTAEDVRHWFEDRWIQPFIPIAQTPTETANVGNVRLSMWEKHAFTFSAVLMTVDICRYKHNELAVQQRNSLERTFYAMEKDLKDKLKASEAASRALTTQMERMAVELRNAEAHAESLTVQLLRLKKAKGKK